MRECYCPSNPGRPLLSPSKSSYQHQTSFATGESDFQAGSSTTEPKRLHRPSVTRTANHESPLASPNRLRRTSPSSPNPQRLSLSPRTANLYQSSVEDARRVNLAQSSRETPHRFRQSSRHAARPHTSATRRDLHRIPSPPRPNVPERGAPSSSRPSVQQRSVDLPRSALLQKRMCIHEKVLSEHIQNKILEERVRYDAALVRANTLLEQSKTLKEQIRALHEDFHELENDFQNVSNINTRFRRAARVRIEYLDDQLQLAELIGKLMAQDQEKNVLGLRRNFPGDLKLQGESQGTEPTPPRPRMSRRKRKFLYKLLCAKGVDKHDV